MPHEKMKTFISIIMFCTISVTSFAGQDDPLFMTGKSVAAAEVILKKGDCRKLEELVSRVDALLTDQENLPAQYGFDNPEFKELSKRIDKVSDGERKIIKECGEKGYRIKQDDTAPVVR
jgi:hypothetical protein